MLLVNTSGVRDESLYIKPVGLRLFTSVLHARSGYVKQKPHVSRSVSFLMITTTQALCCGKDISLIELFVKTLQARGIH